MAGQAASRLIVFAFALLTMMAPAMGQGNPEYVRLSPTIHGALYRPDSGPSPHIAFIIANGGSNILGAVQCRELASRGFMVLCQNTSLEGRETTTDWDNTPLDFKESIPFLRRQAGIKTVLLYGHSGGGSHMAYYQAVAEAGAGFCQRPEKLSRCSDAVKDLPKADGVVFVDAHLGFGIQNLRELNPSVIADPDNPTHVTVDPALDPFSPTNGFSDQGATHYAPDFIARYAAAQAARESELVKKAQAMIAANKAAKTTGPFADLMVLPANGNSWTTGAPLSPTDYDVPGTMISKRPEKLLKNDGTIIIQIVQSAAIPNRQEFELPKKNGGREGIKIETPEAFLSMDAITARNSREDIDWCSSNTSVTCNVEQIKVPTMIAVMGAYKFIVDDERLFDHLAAKDKDYVIIEGALHGYMGCKACEKTPGQYSNAQKHLFDYIRDWTNKRF